MGEGKEALSEDEFQILQKKHIPPYPEGGRNDYIFCMYIGSCHLAFSNLPGLPLTHVPTAGFLPVPRIPLSTTLLTSYIPTPAPAHWSQETTAPRPNASPQPTK